MSFPYPLRSLQMPITRRKVFISYFHGNRDWAQYFVNSFGAANGIFIPKALGLDYDGADRIDSQNTDYVMNQIRERCIDDSSVQIVLIGTCTHSRRYIDWEIKRSLLAGNGLLGIVLPPNTSTHLPERFQANWSQDGSGYAQFRAYPQDGSQLRGWIEQAYEARALHTFLAKNASEVWARNRVCNICRIVH
jgi:antiphage defense system Thoeris ThsB-like protein